MKTWAVLIHLVLGAGTAAAADTATLPPVVPIADRPACTAPDVATSEGTICGLSLEADAADGSGRRAVDAYLGIPYGQSTAGAGRWRPPVQAAGHDDGLKATDYGSVCPQHSPSPKKLPQSEDCLSLNIWTPQGADAGGESALPVMVYIHGGSFDNGSGALPVFDGRYLAASGRVVIVTVNYRLGALGFLGGIEDLTGVYGFQDQQLALAWIRDNIAGFGGDPQRVTLFGESAGAMSVGLHLVAPDSRDLFRAAIMESNPYGIPFKTPNESKRFAETLRLNLGCVAGGLDCLRGKAVETIVDKQASLFLFVDTALSGFAGEVVWAPTLDGSVPPAQPAATPIDKPTLLGTNLNEGLVFVLGERIPWFGTVKVPRIEYDALIGLLFPKSGRSAIRDIPRYRPASGDDTDAVSHVVTDYLFTCANRHVLETATAPVYGYHFTQVPSFDVWPEVPLCAPSEKKVCHTFELPFVFGNPTTVTRQLTPPDDQFTSAERTLSERMAGYWISFAETLDPNHDGAPEWPMFTAANPVRQILNTSITQKTDLGANCAIWDSVGYDGQGILSRIVGGR